MAQTSQDVSRRRVQELEPISSNVSPGESAPPRWMGLAGALGAAAATVLGMFLFAGLAPEADDVAGANSTTTSTTLPPVAFPEVLVASPSGVRVEGISSRRVGFACAERAIDDLVGGFIVDLCDAGIVHMTADGEEVQVAGERFELHFVERIGFAEAPLAVAFDKYPMMDSMDAVGYDVELRTGDIDSIPRFSWYAASPRIQALVGFDLGDWVVAEGCMQIQSIDLGDETKSVGCGDTEEPVVAAAVTATKPQVAYISRTRAATYVLRILALDTDETVASVRLEGEPLSLDYDGQFAVVAFVGPDGVRSTVIDVDSYAKREFDGLASLVREPITRSG